MTKSNNEVQALKTQVFNVSCELDSIFDAYQSLAYLACVSNSEAKSVGVVVVGLNHRLETLLKELEAIYKRGDKDD